MQLVIALAHIAGAIVAVTAVTTLGFLLAEWEGERASKNVLAEAALNFGISVDRLSSDQSLIPKLFQYSAARFSNELFKNRFSDLCGVINDTWGWLCAISQVIVLGAVGWLAITKSLDLAIYVWSIVGITFLYWIVSVIFSMVCRLLTGRYPGQAKRARKRLAELMKTHSLDASISS